MIVGGINTGISQCEPDLIGIMFRNVSGTVADSAIRNFILRASLAGCQSGAGIFVQSGAGQTSTVTVDNCAIHDFRKNGITGNEIGTTPAIAQTASRSVLAPRAPSGTTSSPTISIPCVRRWRLAKP